VKFVQFGGDMAEKIGIEQIAAVGVRWYLSWRKSGAGFRSTETGSGRCGVLNDSRYASTST
jgi:hypothetical protein